MEPYDKYMVFIKLMFKIDTYRVMRELSRLFSDIAKEERYVEVGYLWRIADIFFLFALKMKASM